MAEEDNPYLNLSKDELQAEIQREEENRKNLQDRVRSLRSQISGLESQLRRLREERQTTQRAAAGIGEVRWRDRAVPYNAWRYVYRRARETRQAPNRSYINRMQGYGFSPGEARDLYFEIYAGTAAPAFPEPMAVETRDVYLYDQDIADTSRRIDELEDQVNQARKDIEEEDRRLKQKEEASKVRKQQRIWEYTRYYKYGVTQKPARPSDRREFEVRVYLPFPEDFKEDDVKKYESEADEMADRAMAKAFGRPEVTKKGYDPDTWDTLNTTIPWERESRGWGKPSKPEPMSPMETVTCEAKIIDKIGKWWTGVLTVYVPGWVIPFWSPP